MAELLRWNEMYSVQVQRFDWQHKRIFELLNDLQDAIGARGQRMLASLIEELLDGFRSHFAAEEKAMQQFAYPALERHRVEHQRLTAHLLDFKRKSDTGMVAVSSELITFLKTWLTHHILMVDKGYCPYMAGQEI
jgi:hemerythrin-like metal-binding protein